MRKLFLLFFMYILFGCMNFADANPYYSSEVNPAGYGVLEVSGDVDIYKEPTKDSELLMTLTLEKSMSNFVQMDAPKGSSYYFLAETKKKDKAFLLVADETDDGWYKVFYGKKDGLTGWVNANPKSFKSLKAFYLQYGRKNGVYLFKDIHPEDRKLYAAPFEKAEDKKTVANYEHAYKIKLEIIKGNWMLVRVLDINNNEKIGYLRWRTSDGNIYVFPHL